jgi:hypothetical protein
MNFREVGESINGVEICQTRILLWGAGALDFTAPCPVEIGGEIEIVIQNAHSRRYEVLEEEHAVPVVPGGFWTYHLKARLIKTVTP